MRKQIKLFSLVLSFFFLFSCSQIEEHNSALKITLPSASAVQVSSASQSRNLAFTYSLADIKEYLIVLNKDSESKSYTGKPGETLIIENLQEGEYELLGYAKNADSQIIGYATTKVNVSTRDENNVSLAIKKNIVENIQSITPVNTVDQITVVYGQELNLENIVSQIKVNITYKSGYSVQTPLSDLLASGYYRTGYSLLTENNEIIEGNVVNKNSKSCKLGLYAPDCSIQDFVAAIGNNSAIDSLFANKKTIFDFSCVLAGEEIYFVFYNDEYTVKNNQVLYYKSQEITLQTPVLDGFTFLGWYFYDKENNQTLISDNKINISDLSNYLPEKGAFKARWEVSDITAIDCTKFKAEDYTNGLTLVFNQDFCNEEDSENHDKQNLKTFMNNAKTQNSNLLLNLNLYNCNKCSKFSEEMFTGCTNLKSIDLPINFTRIEEKVFKKCSNLQNVYIHKKVGSICNCAFSGVNTKCNFIIEEGGTYTNTINGNKYSSMIFCKITNPELFILTADADQVQGATKIIPDFILGLSSCVYENTPLAEIQFGKNLTEIMDDAFLGASNLKFVIDSENTVYRTIDNGNMIITTEYEYYTGQELIKLVVDGYQPMGGNRIIPSEVTMIGKSVYKESTLANIFIPSDVIAIQSEAFLYCDGTIELEDTDDWFSIEYYQYPSSTEICDSLISGVYIYKVI